VRGGWGKATPRSLAAPPRRVCDLSLPASTSFFPELHRRRRRAGRQYNPAPDAGESPRLCAHPHPPPLALG
jgi:hypothetical protein